MVPKQYKIILGVIATLFSLWIIIAPLTIKYGTLAHLDGTMMKIDHLDIWNSLNPFASPIYFLGDFMCHQQEARTFIINGNEMPFCSREICIYASAAIGFFIVVKTDMKNTRNKTIFILASFALTILDWFVEKQFSLNLYPVRIITGIMAGISIAMAISFILDSMFEPSNKGNLFK